MTRILLAAVVLALMLLPVAQAADVSGPPNSPSTVVGEVSQIRGNVYILTDKNGNEVRLPIAQDVRFDHIPQLGDWIKAEVSEDGQTRYIQQFPQALVNDSGAGGTPGSGAAQVPK